MWPFSINEAGKVNDGNEEASIKSSINRILSTRIGEQVGNPEFGSKIFMLIFEPVDEVLKVLAKLYVVEALTRWEPRIIINEVDGYRLKDDKRTFRIDIYYFIKKTQQQTSISYDLKMSA